MANKSDKYVRLTEGNALWRSETSDFQLSALVEGAGHAKVSDIPEASLDAVQKGVTAGVLEYTKSLDKSEANQSSGPKGPLVNSDRTSFKWTDDGKQDSGKVLKTPSFSSRTIGIDSEDAVDKQAFNVLSQSPKACAAELTNILAKLDKKDEKVKFLKSCYSIEKSGTNPSMHPRTQVMEYLDDALFNLGISSGLSRITTEEEPRVTNIEPLRFKL
jgi:hypothetical protein